MTCGKLWIVPWRALPQSEYDSDSDITRPSKYGGFSIQPGFIWPPLRDDRLDADPRIREIVLGKIAQDDAIAQQLNLPLRADIQRARQFIVEGGFGRLFAELDKGTLLPAIGVPLISLGLASRDNERR